MPDSRSWTRPTRRAGRRLGAGDRRGRQVTGYEPGFPPQQAWLDERWQPDPLVLDEQAIVINVRDKRLVVLTGCGHAGIVNICRYARVLTGGLPLYAAVGGFHQNGPLFEPLIPRVIDDLAALRPRVLVPAHCTGWRAQHAMSRRSARRSCQRRGQPLLALTGPAADSPGCRGKRGLVFANPAARGPMPRSGPSSRPPPAPRSA
jgi:hypothetical protein